MIPFYYTLNFFQRTETLFVRTYLIHEARTRRQIQQLVYKIAAQPRNKDMKFLINIYSVVFYHLFRSESTVHISETKTARSVAAEGIHLVISGHYQSLVTKVTKDAGKSDLGSELSVQQAEDGPATQVHADIHGGIQDTLSNILC